MLAPAQGRADFIFQDLTTFNLATFDGPTILRLVLAPSINSIHPSDIILAAASDCRTIAIYEVHGLAARPRRIIRACKFCG